MAREGEDLINLDSPSETKTDTSANSSPGEKTVDTKTSSILDSHRYNNNFNMCTVCSFGGIAQTLLRIMNSFHFCGTCTVVNLLTVASITYSRYVSMYSILTYVRVFLVIRV